MKKILILLLFTLFITGCSFDKECERGYKVDGNICYKVKEIKAIHKKEILCEKGYEINGLCYTSNSTAQVASREEYDAETDEYVYICPTGYRLTDDKKSCYPLPQGMNEHEYWECPTGYTFNENGIKENDEIETSGLLSTCYLRVEKEK